MPPLGRKKISRRKPGEKTLKNYFDDGTQQAIVDYQKEEDIEKKKEIYVKNIMPAFDSLVENLINVYGFHVVYETKTDLKNECLEFLYTVVGKFKIEYGSRAFSYFNVVGKNWLTIKSKQNAKNIQMYVSIDNKDALSNHELELLENHSFLPSCDEVVTDEEVRTNLKSLMENLGKLPKTENESICLDAINLLVENLDQIDLLGKRALMLYLREITNLNSKQLSIALSSLRKQYKEVRKAINNN